MSRIGGVLGLAVATAMVVAIGVTPGKASADDVRSLPEPRVQGGMPLMEALAERRSTRAFADRELDEQQLADLLWAAFGVNRPDADGRTAPSWRGSKETDIHVARSDGVWVYAPEVNELRRVSEADIRQDAGRQPFTGQAPIVLIYVADRTRMAEAPTDDQYRYAHVDAALIAQNVYLFAASEGLGTVVLGNVDKATLEEILDLPDEQFVTFAQPVGHPN